MLRYFKAVFWRENRVLKKMKERLFSNWMQKNFQRVSLTIMSGIACRKSCFANSRDCLCGQYIVGQVTEDCFVMEFGGREFVGNYVIQEQRVWHKLTWIELMATKTHIFKDQFYRGRVLYIHIYFCNKTTSKEFIQITDW